MNENDHTMFDDKIASSLVYGDESKADNHSKIINDNKDVPHVLEMKSSEATSNNYFVLKWYTICGDIIFQRFWSGDLTFWMLYAGSLALYTLFFSDLIPYPPSDYAILSSTTTFMYYGIYGIIVTIVLLSFMTINGLETVNSNFKKGLLSLFPILFGFCIYYLFNKFVSVTRATSVPLTIFIYASIGLCAVSYLVSLFRFNKFSYFEVVVSKNIKYVRGLLKGQPPKKEDSKELSYRDKYLALHIIKTDRSLNDFFFKSFQCREVFTDIMYNTPSMFWLSFVLGLTVMGILVSYVLSIYYITSTYDMFKAQTTIILHDGAVIVTTYITEGDFDLFVNCWNTAILITVNLVTLIALSSLIWPILAAVNIRYNLRTGLWRYNRKAYLASYSEITVVDVPGNQIGTVLFGIILYGIVLQLFLFILIYPSLRKWFMDVFGNYLVALCVGILIKMIIVYLLFSVCLYGKGKSLSMYSTAIVVMFFVNLLYGTLSAFYRLCYYIAYSFVALFRFDVTIFPTFLECMDSAYIAFNTFLLHEHETQNPILRCAVELMSRNTVKRLYTYPSSSAYTYTYICPSTCNSKSIANNNANDNGHNNNVNANNSAEDIIDESLNVYGFQLDMNEIILSSLEADIKSRRIRRKWFLAYTLIKNPSLVETRYREEQEVEKQSQPLLDKISKNATEVVSKVGLLYRNNKNDQNVELTSSIDDNSSQNHTSRSVLPL